MSDDTLAETELSKRMRNLAQSKGDLPDNWMEVADAFDAAVKGFYATPQTVSVQKFMGAFARARRMWCDVTGEPLV